MVLRADVGPACGRAGSFSVVRLARCHPMPEPRRLAKNLWRLFHRGPYHATRSGLLLPANAKSSDHLVPPRAAYSHSVSVGKRKAIVRLKSSATRAGLE